MINLNTYYDEVGKTIKGWQIREGDKVIFEDMFLDLLEISADTFHYSDIEEITRCAANMLLSRGIYYKPVPIDGDPLDLELVLGAPKKDTISVHSANKNLNKGFKDKYLQIKMVPRNLYEIKVIKRSREKYSYYRDPNVNSIKEHIFLADCYYQVAMELGMDKKYILLDREKKVNIFKSRGIVNDERNGALGKLRYYVEKTFQKIQQIFQR